MHDLISILLIDDDEDDYIITRDLVEEINHQSYTVDWIPSYEEGLAHIATKQHDVYLIDYRLGVQTGLELLTAGKVVNPEAPYILLTGQGDQAVDRTATEAGAADYLLKSDLTADRLERAIRYGIQQSQNLHKIQQLNQELEQRVQMRTQDLAQAVQDLQQQIEANQRKEAELKRSQTELRKALAKEQELHELKSRFVSMASHEFRTPLATILSSISLIETYGSDPSYEDRRHKHIQRIKNNVHLLTGVLNDFLSLSKLEEGRIRANQSWIDLPNFLPELIEEMQLQAKHGQRINLSIIGPQTHIWQDAYFLRNVIANLLSNAIKYSGEESQIEVRIEIGKHMTIEIEDQGIGIPPEEQPHLFERFFRAKNATHIKGTGLGLSIVQRYVELMEGQISFRSEYGHGTIFLISLPINSPEHETDPNHRG